jgi:hypothetical protein
VSPGEILSLFGGAGGGTALVFCVLLITGWVVPKPSVDEIRQQRDEYKRALDLERARSEASVVTGQIVRDVMISLRKELE